MGEMATSRAAAAMPPKMRPTWVTRNLGMGIESLK
jgi:hypothetical protein